VNYDGGDFPTEEVRNAICTNDTSALQYLVDQGIIILKQVGDPCWECGCTVVIGTVETIGKTKVYRRKGVRGGVRHERSIYHGTFFTRVKVPLPKVLKMLFTCLNGGMQGNLKRDCDVTNQIATIWLAHYKQVIEYDLTTSETLKIGGPGWEVQVDESKFGKVQYTAGGPIGHPVKGVWVLGGVESKNPCR